MSQWAASNIHFASFEQRAVQSRHHSSVASGAVARQHSLDVMAPTCRPLPLEDLDVEVGIRRGRCDVGRVQDLEALVAEGIGGLYDEADLRQGRARPLQLRDSNAVAATAVSRIHPGRADVGLCREELSIERAARYCLQRTLGVIHAINMMQCASTANADKRKL